MDLYLNGLQIYNLGRLQLYSLGSKKVLVRILIYRGVTVRILGYRGIAVYSLKIGYALAYKINSQGT